MKSLLIILFSFLLSLLLTHGNGQKPIIFPAPQEITVGEGTFVLDESVVILVPQKASEKDIYFAKFLTNEIIDKYGVAIKTEQSSKIPSGKRFILIGSVDNQLVKSYCTAQKINVSAQNPGKEGYVLKVSSNNVVVAGSDLQGAFYGLQSLRQLLKKDVSLQIPVVSVRDWPEMPFRGIKMYVPGRENINFYKRFITEFMALYKFNKVILEMNAVMRFDRHPELNAGWVEFAQDLDYSRRNNAVGPKGYYQNSNHRDAGDGGILEKAEVRDLVEFSRENFIDVIPEIATLTHTYYLLTRHKELADVKDSEWPSTYCPSNPATYDLMFDVLDEYIEVMQPEMIHIGRDEWWGAPVDYCELCRGKDYYKLFADDLNKIHNHLAKKGIKCAMWGDHLLESVRNKGHINRKYFTGEAYQTPGALPVDLVKKEIPKDILVFNWFFEQQENDLAVRDLGFEQVYGNFMPDISDWDKRKQTKGVLGGAPSSWTATTEYNFGKDLNGFYLGCASLMWSGKKALTPEEHFRTVQSLMPGVRMNLDGKTSPGETDPITPLKIQDFMNAASGEQMEGVNLGTLKNGRVNSGGKIFDLSSSAKTTDKITVTVGTSGKDLIPLVQDATVCMPDEDVSSIIFLHACAKKARNDKAYRMIYNMDDSADLLGWYEVVYEDGYIETIPVRYGYNILEWNVNDKKNFEKWYDDGQGSSEDRYCYAADAIDCSSDMLSNPITFFAYEWRNPRFGKKIKEITLKGTSGYVNVQNKVIDNNAIMLAGISVVKKREVKTVPEPNR